MLVERVPAHLMLRLLDPAAVADRMQQQRIAAAAVVDMLPAAAVDMLAVVAAADMPVAADASNR
jgi:hypothetical protein